MNRNQGMNPQKFIPITMMAALTFAIVSASGLMTVQAKTVVSDGYTFDAPNGWKVKDRENRYSYVDRTISYEKGGKVGTVTIEHSDGITSLDTDRLEEAIKTMFSDASVFESGSDKYFVNNQSVPYVIATMTKENLFGYKHHYVIMAVTVPLSEDDGLFIQYIAEENDFDKLLGQVEGIIQSVKPTTNL